MHSSFAAEVMHDHIIQCICLALAGGGLSQQEPVGFFPVTCGGCGFGPSVSVGSWPANDGRTVGREKLEYGPIHVS
jgi:hypothetical protein